MPNYKYDHPSIRYTGRFGRLGETMTATACGAYFEIAFEGKECILLFDTANEEEPLGHIYVSVDGGERVEYVISPEIYVDASDEGTHTLAVIYKSTNEAARRFPHPLVGKLSFKGYSARKDGVLAPDDRKTVEFVGDSITEGVAVDPERKCDLGDLHKRPWQNDVTGTYAWRTAEKLGLRPFIMGYGAVGNTHTGLGGVPKTAVSYLENFEGSPVTYPSCDYIVINHGANDCDYPNLYLPEYYSLLGLIRKRNPLSEIFVLSPFCGIFSDTLPEFIAYYNRKENENIRFISSLGWVPEKPIHPSREGHEFIAERLAEEMGETIVNSGQ